MLRCTIAALTLVAAPAFAIPGPLQCSKDIDCEQYQICVQYRCVAEADVIERALSTLHEAESGQYGYASTATQAGETVRLLAPLVASSTEPALQFALARAYRYVAEPRGPDTSDPALVERSLAEAERVRAVAPDFAVSDVASLIGDDSARLGRYERSAREYDRAVAAVETALPDGEGRDYDRARLLENGAEAWMAAGRLDAAIARYTLATRVAPADAGPRSLAWWGLAVALDRDGQIAAAREATRRALVVGSGSTEVPEGLRELTAQNVYFVPAGDKNYYFGLGFLVLGRRDEAVDSFRLFLEKQPGSRWAARARAHLAELAHMPVPDDPTLASDVRVECEDPASTPAEVDLAPLCACASPSSDTAVVVTVDKRGLVPRATAEPRDDAVESCVRAALKGRRVPWHGERVRLIVGRTQR